MVGVWWGGALGGNVHRCAMSDERNEGGLRSIILMVPAPPPPPPPPPPPSTTTTTTTT